MSQPNGGKLLSGTGAFFAVAMMGLSFFCVTATAADKRPSVRLAAYETDAREERAALQADAEKRRERLEAQIREEKRRLDFQREAFEQKADRRREALKRSIEAKEKRLEEKSRRQGT